MTKFKTAAAFFHACEGLEGWDGCRKYVANGAKFTAQSEPLVEIETVEQYCEWMAGLGKGPLAGCGYNIEASSFDDETNTALFFGTFTAQHSGDGGPVPPTGKTTVSHYVYALKMNDDGLIEQMTKIWNAPWALNELGWV